jgi:hypothetical protein
MLLTPNHENRIEACYLSNEVALKVGYDLSKISDICLTGRRLFTLSNQVRSCLQQSRLKQHEAKPIEGVL